MADTNFYQYKDGKKTELCKTCLTAHINNWEPETFLWLLEKFDVPYIEAEWNVLRDRAYKSVARPSVSNTLKAEVSDRFISAARAIIGTGQFCERSLSRASPLGVKPRTRRYGGFFIKQELSMPINAESTSRLILASVYRFVLIILYNSSRSVASLIAEKSLFSIPSLKSGRA